MPSAHGIPERVLANQEWQTAGAPDAVRQHASHRLQLDERVALLHPNRTGAQEMHHELIESMGSYAAFRLQENPESKLLGILWLHRREHGAFADTRLRIVQRLVAEAARCVAQQLEQEITAEQLSLPERIRQLNILMRELVEHPINEATERLAADLATNARILSGAICAEICLGQGHQAIASDGISGPNINPETWHMIPIANWQQQIGTLNLAYDPFATLSTDLGLQENLTALATLYAGPLWTLRREKLVRLVESKLPRQSDAPETWRAWLVSVASALGTQHAWLWLRDSLTGEFFDASGQKPERRSNFNASQHAGKFVVTITSGEDALGFGIRAGSGNG